MRTALLLSCLLGATALPAQDTEFGVPVRTTIEAMRANPDAFHNVKVVFTAQFASLGRISNPFFTKFTPTDYTNFYAWGDDQPIWQEKAYNDVFGMLFLSKSNPQLEQIYSMPLYTRIRVTGVIRNTFQDIPWIEVLEFSKLGPKLDTAVLTHLHRGEKLMEQRLWQRAIAELSLAPGGGVPKAATRAAHKNLGVCLLRMGEPQAAIGYLQSASALAGGEDFEIANLLAMAKTSPEEAIDRTVDSTSLADSERPMWEAFDGDSGPPAGTRVLTR
ncbi:MAG: tetratricopeptide repeat protein [Planctomycetes bacterium]|nr:tetratricopeptide repeat protein [Planctomycetota bacterium]